MNAMIERDQPVATTGPADLLRMAVQQGADIDKLAKLMDLQERWEAKEAKKAFFAAFTAFQSALPPITKNKLVKFGTAKGETTYFFAPLGDIVEQIKAPMQAAGLSYRFEQQHTDAQITVRCIVSHLAGHSESVEMHASLDQSGGKNNIQALGSTTTYLSRYTLCSALGIATADSDEDGELPAEEAATITPEQAVALRERLALTGSDIPIFCKVLGIATVESLLASQYDRAAQLLKAKEDKVEKDNARAK